MASRIASASIEIPQNVEVEINGQELSVKGEKGKLRSKLHELVKLEKNENVLRVIPRNSSKEANMLAGTWRALTSNLVEGVSRGFEKKLILVGVGYKAEVTGNTLVLNLGYSHSINYLIPEGIVVNTPTQTEILIQGPDKQKVGQVAAEVRSYRTPECYKGKGVRYENEKIVLKETKK